MKKVFRITALLLAIAMAALSLCSCQYLDDKKSHQCFYVDDKKSVISYQDANYQLIRPGKLNFLFDDLSESYDKTCFVTDPDVPALLSTEFGDAMYPVRSDIILKVYNSDYNANYYVRDDKFDEMQDAISNAKLDHFCINVYHFDEGNVNDWFDDSSWVSNEIVSDEVTEIVNKALATPATERIKASELSGESDTLSLIVCDKDMFFTDTNANNVRVFRYGFDYYVWDGNVYDDYSIVKIDDKHSDVMKQFFKDFKDTVETDNIAYMLNNYYYDEDYAW